MKNITVSRRSDDYHACVSGEPGKWDCGKTISEAVGNLIMSHREEFDINIDFSQTS